MTQNLSKAAARRSSALLPGLLNRFVMLALFITIVVNVSLVLAAKFVFTGNLLIQTIQLRFCAFHCVRCSSVQVLSPIFSCSTHVGGDGVTFLLQFMQFHVFSLRVKKSQQALARHSLVNGLRQRAAVARFLPGFHGSDARISLLICRIGHRTDIKRREKRLISRMTIPSSS
jgi:hypothetical protein